VCSKPKLITVLTSGVLVSANVWAQPGADAENLSALKSLSLEDLASLKIDTVIGASKHEQEITDAPAAVSIVSGEYIKKQGYRTLGEILRGVRGFYVTDDRAYSAIGMRGVNIPGDFGGRLLITLDGHRVNDPIYDTSSNGMDFLLDVDLIERVEVIRGPGSSLYGNNAFLGVINVITRRGRDVQGAELSATTGSFDTYTGRVTYGNRFTNGVEMVLSGTFYDSQGDRRLYYSEFASINNGIAQDMDGGQAASGFACISWKGLSLEGGYVNREKTWPTAAYSSPEAVILFNDPHFVTTDKRGYAKFQLQQALAEDGELLASVSYDYSGLGGVYPFDYLDPAQPVTLNRDTAHSQSVGGLFQFSGLFLEKHRLTIGTEFRYDYQLDQKNEDLEPPATYLDSQQSGQFWSVFAQDEFSISKQVTLNAGLRYDQTSDFGGTVNPRAALIYHPWKPTTFKLIYGRAFRAPNAFENYYLATGTKRNPNLGPETIRSYELVYEQQVGRYWSGSMSLFYNDIQELIRYREDPADGLYYYDNQDSAQAKGVELEVSAKWPGGWQGRASYTYTQTEDSITGGRLSNAPEQIGKLSFSVPLWRDKLFASAELQAMSERDTLRESQLGPVWLVNATLFSQNLAKGLQLSLSVYNLLDQHYRDPASGIYTQDSLEQDGRSLRAKLTYQF
jgi:iron complex outermembrane receptor protein